MNEWVAVKAPEGQYSPAYYIEAGMDVVADVYEVNGSTDHAHLIAAAPKMLAVLQFIADTVAPGEGTAPLLKKVYAAIAIAKAEGKAP